jgi:DNA-binding transcriptional regulator YbjK
LASFAILQRSCGEQLPQEVLEKLQKLHAALANESPQGVHIIAHGSGHVIQLDDPKLVTDTIRQVVEKCVVVAPHNNPVGADCR